VRFADSDAVQVGEPVAAIGSPFGLEGSLSTGVISAVGRTREGVQVNGRPQRGLLQMDAPVNPGNSGGVLINAAGEVIGVTNSIESPVRGSVGVGFAIPSNVVVRFLPEMIAGRNVQHPWMGIYGADDGSGAPGLLVGGVLAGAPAEQAGIIAGDRLVEVNGEALDDFDQLAAYLDRRAVGDTVAFAVSREGAAAPLASSASIDTHPASDPRAVPPMRGRRASPSVGRGVGSLGKSLRGGCDRLRSGPRQRVLAFE